LQRLLDPPQPGAPALPDEFSLGEQPFGLLGGTCDPQAHPWAGQTDFTSLTQDHLLNLRQPDPRLELHFASPVSFHSERKHLPFPLPGLVARRWLEAWNAYAPTRFPDDLTAWAESSLAVSRYRLESAVVDTGQGKIIGFTGHCAYHMLDHDPYWSRLLVTLAAFAFYCGTGVKTSTGMGQTRLQPPIPRRTPIAA
jgi:CRISPR-associated endoribonuclease Cas6